LMRLSVALVEVFASGTPRPKVTCPFQPSSLLCKAGQDPKT